MNDGVIDYRLQQDRLPPLSFSSKTRFFDHEAGGLSHFGTIGIRAHANRLGPLDL
jgi:hypothetical protein